MKDEFIDSVLKEYFSIDDEIKRLTKSKEKLRDIIVSNFKLNNVDSKEYIIEDCDYNASVSSVTRKTTTPNMDIIKQYIPDSRMEEAFNTKISSSVTIRRIEKNKPEKKEKFANIVSDLS